MPGDKYVTHDDLSIALNQRVGPVEKEQALQARRLNDLSQTDVEIRDLLVKMLTPVMASLEMTQKQLTTFQKQINKLFHLASKKKRKPK